MADQLFEELKKRLGPLLSETGTGDLQLGGRRNPAADASPMLKGIQKPYSVKNDVLGRSPQLLGGASAKIGPKPEPSIPRKILEMITGYPADPDRDMGPIEAMLATIPAFGAAKGLGVVDGIPMDWASRMARATEQGYTTPVWHGTKKAFSEFSGPIRNDRGDFGIHVATDPRTSAKAIGAEFDPSQQWALDVSGYSPGEGAARINNPYLKGANTIPMLARIQKPFEVKDVGLWKTPGSWTHYPGESAMMKTTNDPETLRAIMDAASRHGNPPGIQHDPDRGQQGFQRDLLEILRSKNYDSIKYPNNVEGKGEPSYLLLDPSQLRSIFAKFDPRNIGSKDLLAGAVPPAILASQDDK